MNATFWGQTQLRVPLRAAVPRSGGFKQAAVVLAISFGSSGPLMALATAFGIPGPTPSHSMAVVMQYARRWRSLDARHSAEVLVNGANVVISQVLVGRPG